MICNVKLDSISADDFYKAPKPDTFIKFQKGHQKFKKRNGVLTIISEFNDTNTFYDYNDGKKVVESNCWIKKFSFLRSRKYYDRYTYLGYSNELTKQVVYYKADKNYFKSYIFIDKKSGDMLGVYAKPVFSPDRKKMASFQSPRPDLGHDLTIHLIEEDEIIKIYETPVYKLGDWDIKEIKWIDNNTLVVSAKTPRTTSFGGKAIKQKECFYKLSFIKCDKQ
jgi:hypothetical protein